MNWFRAEYKLDLEILVYGNLEASAKKKGLGDHNYCRDLGNIRR